MASSSSAPVPAFAYDETQGLDMRRWALLTGLSVEQLYWVGCALEPILSPLTFWVKKKGTHPSDIGPRLSKLAELQLLSPGGVVHAALQRVNVDPAEFSHGPLAKPGLLNLPKLVGTLQWATAFQNEKEKREEEGKVPRIVMQAVGVSDRVMPAAAAGCELLLPYSTNVAALHHLAPTYINLANKDKKWVSKSAEEMWSDLQGHPLRLGNHESSPVFLLFVESARDPALTKDQPVHLGLIKQLVRSLDPSVEVPYIDKAPMPTDMWEVFDDPDFAWNRHHTLQFRKDWGREWGLDDKTTGARTHADGEDASDDLAVHAHKPTKIASVESADYECM